MDKILTVSVAAYNVEKYLNQCLDSFIKPVIIPGVEVLIVNDGSTDSTLSIAEEYKQKYPDIFRVIDKENGGWGSTLNAAMAQAEGKYFKQLDGDDYYDNGNLINFIKKLMETDADIVVTPYSEFDDQTGEIIRVLKEDESIDRNKDFAVSEIEDQLNMAMHAITVKTDLIRKNKVIITENCFYTDTEFLIMTFDRADTIMLCDMPIYWYRLGNAGQSVSIEGYIRHYQDMIKISFNMLEYEKTAPNRKNTKVAHSWISRHIKNTYRVLWAAAKQFEIRRAMIQFDKKLVDEYGSYSNLAQRAVKLWRKNGYRCYRFFKLMSKIHNKA